MKTPSCSLRNPIVFAAILLSTLVPLARAGTDIWSGGGGSSNIVWLSTFNWQAGTVKPAQAVAADQPAHATSSS